MTYEEALTKTETAFQRTFGAQLAFDARLSRLEAARWTSLKHVEFIIALEKEFATRFDGADATDMTSIPVVIERVLKKLS